ncbi:DUF4143 domain-containing protein [Metamycoplasma equirhinis]|uniref:DUF4143 domain-containing protein n=1 Tax=Metamycoplasma equirhinis TaxID=92402 RepID=UPI0035931961
MNYINSKQIKILNCKSFLNYGAIYEAVMAQELIAHGFQSYYNNDKKRGEIDLLIELNNKVISIEVIFGKDYKRHSVLNQLVHNQNFDYQIACVLCNKNGKRMARFYTCLYTWSIL